MTATALAPADFTTALERHHHEYADDVRRVIVGLQPESRMAEIYARHGHLYTRGQVDALASARDAATGSDREALRRLWFAAADMLALGSVVQAAQDLTNDRLAWRGTIDGEELSINALGAMLASEDGYERRERIFGLMCEADDHFAERDIDLADRSQRLRSEVFGIAGEVALAEDRMGIDLREFADRIEGVLDRTAHRYAARCERLFPHLLGRDATRPSRAHASWLRSLHGRDSVYTRERMADVCGRTLAELGFPLDQVPTIIPDLEDRPEKDPRACVIPVRVPHEVHLVVRPTGGITDYQAFLHEAGHALHFGLTDVALPFSQRELSPDNALTEVWSYVVERITHEPAWHERHFGCSPDEARQAVDELAFIDATLFRRYAAKLRYEIGFWSDPRDPSNPDAYATLLADATRMQYPTSQYASDIDPGLYAADYLRAWRTSLQVIDHLRRECGVDWFCSGEAAPFLREQFARGTGPSNEDVQRAVGHAPDDFGALEASLTR